MAMLSQGDFEILTFKE